MVDFVKNKSGMPVGSQLTFARGLADKLEIDGAVWLKNGVYETDKSKFDVDYWRSAAYYSVWGVDLSTGTPALTFTQLAMGKVAGKRLTLFTKADGNIIYGTKDDGKTVEPILTDDHWLGQTYIFWYKDRFIIQTGTSGISSITWDGTTLGAPVTETNLSNALQGSYISCVNVLGDKIVLGTGDGKLITSNDGITWTPVAIWNSSAEKPTVDVCKITSVAISKTGDTFAAAGYSTTKSLGFIVQVNNQFIGTGQTLVFNTNFTIKDSTIIHAGGYWICGVWCWTTTPDKRQPGGNIYKGSFSPTNADIVWFDLGEQLAWSYTTTTGAVIADVETMVFSGNNAFGYNAVNGYAKTAVDLEDKILIALDGTGTKLTANRGIIAGAATSTTSTHTRIK